MEFLVFRRTCTTLIVVPALFSPPAASHRQWPVRLVCSCEMDLDELSPPLRAHVAEHGFGVACDGDWRLIEARLTRLA